MSSIFLVRHCKYANPHGIMPGRLPVELSKEGLVQAEKLHTYFQDRDISHIYSSAVVRCKKTSEYISNTKIPITYDKRLLETLSAYQGYWDDSRWQPFFENRALLGGEGAKDISIRMVSFYEEIAKGSNQNIIICSHGDPLYMLYLHIAGKPLINDVDDFDVITDYQEKGSVREIVMKNKQVRQINEIVEF